MQTPQAGRMSNRHLPAGQVIPGGGAAGAGTGGGISGDMAGSVHTHAGSVSSGGGGAGGGGSSGAGTPRRRIPHGHHNHNHGHGHGSNHNHAQGYAPHLFQPQHNPMYPGYVQYPAQMYQGMPAGPGAYQSNALPAAAYMQPYAPYSRSPPTIPHYPSMVAVGSVGLTQLYNGGSVGRQGEQSPVLASPYQPPPPMAPLTPSSTRSYSSPQTAPPSHSPSISQLSQSQEQTPPIIVSSLYSQPPAAFETEKDTPDPAPHTQPFRPPLPWVSVPDVTFPSRVAKFRRRKRTDEDELVPFPEEQQHAAAAAAPQEEAISLATSVATPSDSQATSEAVKTPASVSAVPVASDTPTTASDAKSPLPIPTPASPISPKPSVSESTTPTVTASLPAPAKHPARPIPAVPIVPVIPKTGLKETRSPIFEKPPLKPVETAVTGFAGPAPAAPAPAASAPAASASATSASAIDATVEQPKTEENPAPAPRAAPKSWASLVARVPDPAARRGPAGANGVPAGSSQSVNGSSYPEGHAVSNDESPFAKSGSASLVVALQSYRVGSAEKVLFLEPRGLINTGNMCYMNSILQVVLFCVPFYDLLDQIGKKATHSFKSETPLIDAMILFLHEFKVIDAATSVEQLRRRLKPEELEQYGDPFTPEYVYDVIRKLPRFVNMRRGHQQDAEEFLGFLLQSLDDECIQAMGGSSHARGTSPPPRSPAKPEKVAAGVSEWLEVGPRQRSAVTRSSGLSSSSPITKIFGGLLRSELRVPGLMDSITNEPYQPLQLDIGSPAVHNIVDALRSLTTPETITGNFNPERGEGVSATKQVFIETLPPVLVLHLKRFQFDAHGNGTVKLWKKVGYPLELEIPREVLSRQKRSMLHAETAGVPRYRLAAVVYHHGKNASGGHYTVDIRRQDDREWIRFDDTLIRRISSDDVAEAGEEERPRQVRRELPSGHASNRSDAATDEDAGDDDGWKRVSSSVNGGKRWSSVVNGNAATSTKSKQAKESIRDNKVAYILFYQRA